MLEEKAKDDWDKTCKTGNGEDDPIDPDAPDPDDFEQVVTNFISKIAEQKTPVNVEWEYLRNLKYQDILKKRTHAPTKYLKQIEKLKKASNKHSTVTNTEPTDKVKDDHFLQSISPFDHE